MDKNDSNFNFPPYMNYDIGCDPIIGDPNMFNPCMQYEQAYMYYRYMTQQIEYKIKCKIIHFLQLYLTFTHHILYN